MILPWIFLLLTRGKVTLPPPESAGHEYILMILGTIYMSISCKCAGKEIVQGIGKGLSTL